MEAIMGNKGAFFSQKRFDLNSADDRYELFKMLHQEFEGKSEQEDGDDQKSGLDFIRSFYQNPQEVVEKLKPYVINQDEAILTLASTVCGHYNRIRYLLENGIDPMEDDERIKPNMLLIGSTGVGKTYVVRMIAKLLGVPFIKRDSTKFSETGYVGEDVESVIRDLVKAANGDVSLAQYGIVFFDEVDKIAKKPTHGIDVSRGGVQSNLLSIVEDADVSLVAKNDIREHIKMQTMAMQGKKPQDKQFINTKNILFIFAGVFPHLSDLTEKRLGKGSIGFKGDAKKTGTEKDEMLCHLKPEDLITYGFEAELIGRIPVRIVMKNLEKNDLLEILKKPKSSIMTWFTETMAAYGIKATIAEDVLNLIASDAHKEKTGARGLVSAFEDCVEIFKAKLPGCGIERFELTLDAVNGNKGKIIAELIAEGNEKLREIKGRRLKETIFREETETQLNEQKQEDAKTEQIKLFEESLKDYQRYIAKQCMLKILFHKRAKEKLFEMVENNDKTPNDICQSIFNKNFEPAFELISRRQSELEPLTITLEALEDPMKFFEDNLSE